MRRTVYLRPNTHGNAGSFRWSPSRSRSRLHRLLPQPDPTSPSLNYDINAESDLRPTTANTVDAPISPLRSVEYYDVFECCIISCAVPECEFRGLFALAHLATDHPNLDCKLHPWHLIAIL